MGKDQVEMEREVLSGATLLVSKGHLFGWELQGIILI